MATIYDVANKANVSISTVSRVINNKGYVSKDKKKVVLSVIDKLNYSPSLLARSMRTKLSHYVGFIFPDIMDHFFSSVIRGIDDFLLDNGYSLILGNAGNSLKKIESQLRLFLNKEIDFSSKPLLWERACSLNEPSGWIKGIFS